MVEIVLSFLRQSGSNVEIRWRTHSHLRSGVVVAVWHPGSRLRLDGRGTAAQWWRTAAGWRGPGPGLLVWYPVKFVERQCHDVGVQVKFKGLTGQPFTFNGGSCQKDASGKKVAKGPHNLEDSQGWQDNVRQSKKNNGMHVQSSKILGCNLKEEQDVTDKIFILTYGRFSFYRIGAKQILTEKNYF